MDVGHASVVVPAVRFLAVRKTCRATVPEAPRKFVHRPGIGVETVDVMSRVEVSVFSRVACMLETRTMQGMLLLGVVEGQSHLIVLILVLGGQSVQGFLPQLVVAPRQPFYSTY